jgi:hypothetical protein
LGNTANEKFFAQFVVFVFGAFALRELRRGRFGQRSNEKVSPSPKGIVKYLEG